MVNNYRLCTIPIFAVFCVEEIKISLSQIFVSFSVEATSPIWFKLDALPTWM